MATVMVVEDDGAIRQALTRGLTAVGHVVTPVAQGADAVAAYASAPVEVVILDLGLPDMEGESVLGVLRALGDVPVIVATARDDDRDVVRLLDAGADDYLVKPFSVAQMDARIRAVLRRTSQPQDAPAVVSVGEIRLDPRSREVTLAGAPLELSRLEFDLLHFLMQRAGEVVTKPALLAEVWRQPWGGADRTVDVHLSWLRRKLGETAAEPRYLVSVRGVGVKLVDPEAVQ
ncbi:MAG: response regulator transcription factor [Nocardioidaceae bacterium]|nr:response regulator transcription factor [Nocardioidaceae bacterium]MCL2614309.1 response regulator transcription factor [Nocardioidaceae bacterium]